MIEQYVAIPRPVRPPTGEDLYVFTHTIAMHVARYLENTGYLERDAKAG